MNRLSLILSVFFTVIIDFSGTAQTLSEFDEKTVSSYLDCHSADSLNWWLTDSGSKKLLDRKIVEISDYLSVFREKIPPTTPLADFLNNSTFSFGYLAGDSAIFPEPKNSPGSRNILSICFIPRSLRRNHPFMAYEGKEKRLLFWAVRCPENVFATLFFYGLQLAATGNPKKNQERREGLMLAANILNQSGRGELFDCLDSLLVNLPAENPLDKVSAAELKNIDEKIGAKTLGKEIAKEILPIYYVALQSRLMLKRSHQR
jgi:hypothetical protein